MVSKLIDGSCLDLDAGSVMLVGRGNLFFWREFPRLACRGRGTIHVQIMPGHVQYHYWVIHFYQDQATFYQLWYFLKSFEDSQEFQRLSTWDHIPVRDLSLRWAPQPVSEAPVVNVTNKDRCQNTVPVRRFLHVSHHSRWVWMNGFTGTGLAIGSDHGQ